MSNYVWPTVWKDKLRSKFTLDKDGFIKYPPNIDEILNIIEDAVRSAPPPNTESKGEEASDG
jgi:hypothetical protein